MQEEVEHQDKDIKEEMLLVMEGQQVEVEQDLVLEHLVQDHKVFREILDLRGFEDFKEILDHKAFRDILDHKVFKDILGHKVFKD